MNFNKIYEAVKAEIKKQGLKQTAVAKSLDLSSSTLTSWLNGNCGKPEKEATMPAFFKLVDMFGINFDDFADHSSMNSRIEYLRFKNKLSTSELSKKANLSPATIQDIEGKRTRRITPDTARKLASAFNTSEDYILHGNKKKLKNGLVDLSRPTVQMTIEEAAPVDDKPEAEPVVEDDEVITLSSTEKSLKVFDFEESIIRTVLDDDGETLFFAKDVCDVLGYVNSRDAVKTHCKEKGVVKRDTLSKGGKQQAIFINEPNLMRLIVKSKMPAAEKFEAWVFEEVLPTIRKTGKYEVPNREVNHLSPEVLAVLRQARIVQVAMGMGKAESRKYANNLIKVKFGFDMSHATTDGLMKQLDFLND